MMFVDTVLNVGESGAVMDSGYISQTAEYSFLHDYK